MRWLFQTMAHPGGADGPEVALIQRELRRRIDSALDTLPDEHREIFWKAAVGGWSAPELAETMGIKPGAVRTRLTRIRRVLRAELREPATTQRQSDARARPDSA